MTFFRILNFYMKGACGAFPKQTAVSLLSLCSDFQIIAEKRVLVFWNLIWLRFAWDTLVHYCQLKPHFSFPRSLQAVLWKWCPPFLPKSSFFFFFNKLSSCKNIFFHILVRVTKLWSLRILPFLQEFSRPAKDITLLVHLQWIIVRVSLYSIVCLNSLSSINKHGWIIMFV